MASSKAWPAAHAYLAAARELSEAEALSAAHADALALPPGAPGECLTLLNSPSLMQNFVSQFGQDATIYYSMLAGKLARGERGFYVDLGAHDEKTISNTWFLDKCLGWQGLCVEANPELAEKLRQSSRTCKVVNKCAAEKVGTLQFVSNGAIGHIAAAGQGGVEIPCAPLSELLRSESVSQVDFMSVDIEGNEISALSGTDWDAVPIQLILIESAWASERLDLLLADAGFWRMADIGYADDLYIRAPRLRYGSTAYNTQMRKGNWEWLAEQSHTDPSTGISATGRCIKRMGTIPG